MEDFKQEDKLELLVKVLSNEEILEHLYKKIFNKTGRLEVEKQKWEGREMQERNLSTNRERLGRSERVVSRLPAISARRS